MKRKNQIAMYAVQKKSIYTKHQWVKTGEYDSPHKAQAEAEYLQSSKFIVSRGKPQPKQQVRIVKIG